MSRWELQGGSAPFARPDLGAPLDVEAHLGLVPAYATARGMFFQSVVDDLKRAGLAPRASATSYVAFRSYPMRDYLRLVLDAAEQLHPGVPTREALRRLGQDVYPQLAETLIGKSIFAFAGNKFARVAALAGKAYDVCLDPGAAALRDASEGRVVVELRDVWAFPDSLHLGTWEGALRVTKSVGEIKVRRHSPCDVDFEITWR